jgi:hypothetical protein
MKILTLFVFTSAMLADGIVSTYISASYARLYLTVSDTDVTCASAREAIGNLRKQHPARQLYLVRLCASAGGCPKGFESSSFAVHDSVLKLREQQMASDPAIAEAIAASDGYVARVRSRGGNVERCAEGSDPLSVKIGRTTLSVLWVEYQEIQRDRPSIETASVFATTDRSITKDEAVTAYEEIRRRFPATAVMLQVSDRPWFPGLTSFPAFYPFDERFVPPSKEDNEARGSASCFAHPKMDCFVFGSWK